MKSWIPAILCGACLVPGSAAPKQQNQLTWDAFAALVNARSSIRMILPDGTLIEGHPITFRPEALDISLYKTSNRQLHRKGSMTIRRETVSVVDIRKARKRGRLIGTLVPIGAGAAMMAGATARSIEGPLYELLAAGALTMGVGGPAGYFTGRAVDRRFEQFIIIPEAKPANPR